MFDVQFIERVKLPLKDFDVKVTISLKNFLIKIFTSSPAFSNKTGDEVCSKWVVYTVGVIRFRNGRIQEWVAYPGPGKRRSWIFILIVFILVVLVVILGIILVVILVILPGRVTRTVRRLSEMFSGVIFSVGFGSTHFGIRWATCGLSAAVVSEG